MAPPERIRLVKNAGCENERERFTKIDNERPKNITTMSPIDRKIALGVVLLYKHNALRVI